jgi:hypothetical protein
MCIQSHRKTIVNHKLMMRQFFENSWFSLQNTTLWKVWIQTSSSSVAYELWNINCLQGTVVILLSRCGQSNWPNWSRLFCHSLVESWPLVSNLCKCQEMKQDISVIFFISKVTWPQSENIAMTRWRNEVGGIRSIVATRPLARMAE